MDLFRRFVEKFEADLFAVGDGDGSKRGELERKRYADGCERLKIRIRAVQAEDGAPLAVAVNGLPVCQLTVERGRGRVELRSERGDVVPVVDAGQLVEVSLAGEPLLRGEFERE